MTKRLRGRLIPAPEGFLGCARCMQVKPIDEFHVAKRHASGRASNCKTCKSEIQKAAKGRGDLTIAERFWPRVAKAGPDDCWEWIGPKIQGYGRIWYRGTNQMAHRVAWVLAGREPPVFPLALDHRCRNTGCVNVNHLRIVTQAANCSILAPGSCSYVNAIKTHCKRGHEFTPENTAHPKGAPHRRQCRECMRMKSKLYAKPKKPRETLSEGSAS